MYSHYHHHSYNRYNFFYGRILSVFRWSWYFAAFPRFCVAYKLVCSTVNSKISSLNTDWKNQFPWHVEVLTIYFLYDSTISQILAVLRSGKELSIILNIVTWISSRIGISPGENDVKTSFARSGGTEEVILSVED